MNNFDDNSIPWILILCLLMQQNNNISTGKATTADISLRPFMPPASSDSGLPSSSVPLNSLHPVHSASADRHRPATHPARPLSPINIRPAFTQPMSYAQVPRICYTTTPYTIEADAENCTQLFVPHTATNYIILDDIKYTVVQMHFHTPSEHEINSKKYPLELHIVHADEQDNLAVIAIFIEAESDSFSFTPNVLAAPQMNIEQLIPLRSRIFRYTGTTTTPPYSEDIRWVVYEHPLCLPEGQIQDLKTLYAEDACPIQITPGQKVLSFDTGHSHN